MSAKVRMLKEVQEWMQQRPYSPAPLVVGAFFRYFAVLNVLRLISTATFHKLASREQVMNLLSVMP
jgi:hypothetical protein